MIWGPTGTNLRTSEMPSAPDLCVTRMAHAADSRFVAMMPNRNSYSSVTIRCSQRRMLCLCCESEMVTGCRGMADPWLSVEWCRRHRARGDVIIVRFADELHLRLQQMRSGPA